MFLFLLSLFICSFNLGLYSSDPGFLERWGRQATGVDLALSSQEKRDHIRAIYLISDILGNFLDKKYSGVEIYKNESFFSKKTSVCSELKGHDYYGRLSIINRGIVFSAPATITHNNTYPVGKSGVGHISCVTEPENKIYGLITPWGPIELFGKIDGEGAKKFGPDNFENKLFDCLRNKLKLEFMSDPLFGSEKDGFYEIEGLPTKINQDRIVSYIGTNKRVVCKNSCKHVHPSFYYVTQVNGTSLPRFSTRYSQWATSEDYCKYDKDFYDLTTQHKAAVVLGHFVRNKKSKKDAVLTDLPCAGGAGSGSVE